MKWEYIMIEIRVTETFRESTIAQLNKLGEEGWKAVSPWAAPNVANFVLFKRQKPK